MQLTERDIIIDIETRCDLDISKVGTYKYCRHTSCEILLFSFVVGNVENRKENVVTYVLGRNGDAVTQGGNAPVAHPTEPNTWYVETLPQDVLEMLCNPYFRKHAHNVAFEATALQMRTGLTLDMNQWYDSKACVAFCGLP
jgi:DNA polymerase